MNKIKIIILSLLFILLCLFLSLNQEVYATDDIYVNIPSINVSWNLTQILEDNNVSFDIDINNTEFIFWHYVSNGWYVLFATNENYYMYNGELCCDEFLIIRANPLPEQQYIDICSVTSGSYSVVYNGNIINEQYSNFYLTSNATIFTDDTLEDELDLSNANNITISNFISNTSGGGRRRKFFI